MINKVSNLLKICLHFDCVLFILYVKKSLNLKHLTTSFCIQGFPDSSVGKESTCNAGDPGFDSWVGKICWRRERLPTPVFLGFPCGSGGKESACNVGDLGSIPGLGRFPGEGKGYPFQYSGLESSTDCIVHGVMKSRILLSNFHFHLLLFRGLLVVKNPPAMQDTWV